MTAVSRSTALAVALHGSASVRTLGREEADARVAKARARGKPTRFERVRPAR